MTRPRATWATSACRLSVRAKSQSGGDRPLAPMIAARPQDRRFPSRRPSGSDRRLLRETGFVLEEDPGALVSPAGSTKPLLIVVGAGLCVNDGVVNPLGASVGAETARGAEASWFTPQEAPIVPPS
jgi:hypothetical protein